MAWSEIGPERAAAIEMLRAQIRVARGRLESIGATADAQEVSFHLRDEADLAYGHLRREVGAMEAALELLLRPVDR